MAAFYQRYKDSKRIHAFNLGWLGFYGEWSKWPFKCPDEFCIEESTKKKLIEGFITRRTVGFVGARYPKEEIIKDYKGQAISFSDGTKGPNHI